MRMIPSLILLAAACLSSCRPMTESGASGKRLAQWERSAQDLTTRQIAMNRLLTKIAKRQDLLIKGMRRMERRVKNDRYRLGLLENASDRDAEDVEQLSFVVNKMIDPIAKMRGMLVRMNTKVMRLHQKVNEVAAYGSVRSAPATAKMQKPKEESPTRPVDKKKRKKVLESVA